MTRRLAVLAIVAIIIATSVRVASTHDELSATSDEHVHIAAGHDYLTGRPYTFDIEHPPLTRAVFAVPLVLDGVPQLEEKGWQGRGVRLLAYGGKYRQRLVSVRRMNLIFLVLALIAVALWAWRRIGPWGAAMATLLFAMLPPVLAHAGVAATDMAAAALLPWALLTLEWWADRPTAGRAAILGIAIGVGLTAKFSFVPFFGGAALIIVATRKIQPRATLLISAAVAALIVWGAFRFEVGTIDRSYAQGKQMVQLLTPWLLRDPALAVAEHVPLPAPLFFTGMMDVALHNRRGHPTNFLFGEHRRDGWWYYFAVALLLKTPIAFLLLAAAGAWLAVRRRDYALPAIAAALLITTFPVHINIGVRHILPMYGPLAILAADAAIRARGLWRIAAGIAVAATIAVSVAAHPNYISWFNAIAGKHPERILGDSNLDWSQDGLRLARLCRRLGVTSLLMASDNSEPELPPFRLLNRTERIPPGSWVAVTDFSGEFQKKDAWVQDLARATRRYRAGTTTTLYYIP